MDLAECVCPSCVIRLLNKKNDLNLSGAMPPKEIDYLFWVIVGSFRVMNFANSRRQDTSENVSLAIQGVLTSSPFAVPKGKFGSFGLTYRNLGTATEFSMLMAALDMFLLGFPSINMLGYGSAL